MSEELKNRIEALKNHYRESKGAIMPALHIIQNEGIQIDKEAAYLVAEILEVPVTDVWQVYTFYTMYAKRPRGKFHIEVCRNISCSLMGAEHIVERIKEMLNIEPGSISEDKRFSLELVECLGSCGSAPVMCINGKYYENVDKSKLEEIINELKQK